MKKEFWLQRWEEGQIGFHQDAVHPDLLAHQARLLGGSRKRVFVPLCGKSRDLAWLAAQGHEVVGAELSAVAVRQLFEEAGLEATVTAEGGAERWQSGSLTVFCGDLFALTDAQLGRFDRIWDRAALVALPEDMRGGYTERLRSLLTDDGAILLNCFRYGLPGGPPHSISEHEVFRRYGDGFSLELLRATDGIEQAGRFKEAGATEFVIMTWWLQRRAPRAHAAAP